MKEFFTNLTWVDYCIFIALLRGIYVGYKSGFFAEVLRILAYIITVIVTLTYRGMLSDFLTVNTFLNQTMADVVAFGTLFLGVLLLLKLVTMVFVKALKIGEGSIFSRVAGMILGASRWLILMSLFFMMIQLSPLTPLKTDIQSKSLFGPKIATVAPMIFEFLSSLSPQLNVKA